MPKRLRIREIMQAGTKYARERRRTGWIDPALTETGGEKACAVAALH